MRNGHYSVAAIIRYRLWAFFFYSRYNNLGQVHPPPPGLVVVGVVVVYSRVGPGAGCQLAQAQEESQLGIEQVIGVVSLNKWKLTFSYLCCDPDRADSDNKTENESKGGKAEIT